MPYPNEWSCRLMEPGDVRVVGSQERTHDGKTYRVIFGIPKGGEGSVEQAYRYPKATWTREQAATHCRSHDGRFEAAFEGGDGLELIYLASVHSIESGHEQNLATFYLMNTSRNRNVWGVTDKALEEALPTLLQKPIGIGPDYKADRHYEDPLTTGTFIKVDKPNGYALGTTEITDPKAWELLKAGEVGPISVVISSYRETCSHCGESLTGSDDPFQHTCIQNEDAFVQVESFTFQRVDFINVPAYPQAGLLNMAADSQIAAIPLELLAGFYTSQSMNDFEGAAFRKAPTGTPWEAQSSGRGAGSPGHEPTTRTKEKERKTPDMSKTLEEATAKIAELEASVDDLTKERDNLQAQLENPETDEECAAVKTELAALKQRIHDDLVEAAVAARFDAGLTATKEDERTRLATYPDELLQTLTEDADAVAAKLAAAKPTGPKARYGASETDTFQAALEAERLRLFGYRRNTESTVVS